jgi:hypothetical protein
MLRAYLQSERGQKELLLWLLFVVVAVLAGILAEAFIIWKPSGDFVSDASGFAAAVVSLAVPLGLDVLGRFSEKYGSNRPMRFFVPHLRIVPVILSVFVLIASAVILQAGGWETPPCWFVWFNFLMFWVMAAWFFMFLSNIVRFVVWEPSALIDEMAVTIARAIN